MDNDRNILNYLNLLHSQCPNAALIHLILDFCSVHRCEASEACALKLRHHGALYPGRVVAKADIFRFLTKVWDVLAVVVIEK
jgi:hypothetical protein